MARRIDDGHIHVFAGDPMRCIHCGSSLIGAHIADPVLYPLPEESKPEPGYIKFTPPPQSNTHIHLGNPPGDFVFHFYRTKPFTRFQIQMMGWCFGWKIEQEPAVHGN